MDTITHAIAGGVIAKAFFPKRIKNYAVSAAVIASTFPDFDYVLTFISKEVYLRYHRGVTHSIFFIIPLALLLSFLFAHFRDKEFKYYFYLSLVSISVHIFFDLITSFGTMIFAPFSDARVSFDTVFIVDLIFSGILIASFLAGMFFKKTKPFIYKTSLITLAIYIGICSAFHNKALNLAKTFTTNETVSYSALPQPFSFARWNLLIEEKNTVKTSFVDFFKKGDKSYKVGLLKSRIPVYSSPYYLIFETFDKGGKYRLSLNKEKELDFFYWFARYPIAWEETYTNGEKLINFFDLRFSSVRGRYPFLLTYKLDANGRILSKKLFNSVQR